MRLALFLTIIIVALSFMTLLLNSWVVGMRHGVYHTIDRKAIIFSIQVVVQSKNLKIPLKLMHQLTILSRYLGCGGYWALNTLLMWAFLLSDLVLARDILHLSSARGEVSAPPLVFIFLDGKNDHVVSVLWRLAVYLHLSDFYFNKICVINY